MSDYIVENMLTGNIHRVSLSEVNELSNRWSRKILYDRQSKGEIRLFCGCNEQNRIRMTVTSHSCPHIITHNKQDRSRHFEYCRHHVDNNGGVPNIYKGAISVDESTGESLYNVDFTRISNVCEPGGYVGGFYTSSYERIYERRMSFYEFVKYMNMTYFPTFQRRNDCNFTQYLGTLWGKICHARLFNSKGAPVEFCNYLKANKLEYTHSCIKNVEPYYKKDCSISDKQQVILFSNGYKLTVSNYIFDKAVRVFKACYGLDFNNLLTDPRYGSEFNVLLCAIYDKTNVYSDKAIYCLMLVNKYGLYSEGIVEALSYNAVCDVFANSEHLRNLYLIRRPYYPENIYRGHLFYIPCVILENRRLPHKIVFECFSSPSAQYDNSKQIVDKANSCIYDHIYYDPFHRVNARWCFDDIEDSILALKDMLKWA